LSLDQAMYYFLSGYTAKLAGTELGQLQPQPTFSTCFGSPFMPRPPVSYAELLRARIRAVSARVWLVNTGWIAGPYGEGRRIAIADTRRIIDAILGGRNDASSFREDPRFGLRVPVRVPGLAESVLDVRAGFRDAARYDREALALARRFRDNFATYAASVPAEVTASGPRAD
jgi:phosphoenolpyruvate carboxykinase (ATP)